VVITGGERVFSAGADVTEFEGLDPAAIMAYYQQTGDFVERVADLAQPTIAAICGYCLGGGFELALARDFRIADDTAVFGLPEVGLGIVPSFGGTYRLTRIIGAARAKELILLRDRIDAAEARRLGAVTEVVSAGQALARALEHAERLAELPALAASVAARAVDAMSGSRECDALRQRRFLGIVDAVRRPAHAGAPGVRAGLAAAAGRLLPAERSADRGAGGADVDVDDPAVGAVGGEEAFGLALVAGEDARGQSLRNVVMEGECL
jgi:enoyl-CoA hydratase/carnithine racemase